MPDLARSHTSLFLHVPAACQIPYSENWPDEVAKMMADKKPTSYFLCTKAGKTIPFVADGAPGELTKTTRVDDVDFPIELVCQARQRVTESSLC